MMSKSDESIKVVLLKPGRPAAIIEIDSTLNSMQKIVGGYIEAVYPFDEQVCIVCNEEGKLNGLPLNRALRIDEKVFDIVAGTCFVCAYSDGNFCSLSKEQQERYKKMFEAPEQFVMLGDKILVLPYIPREEPRSSLNEKIQSAGSCTTSHQPTYTESAKDLER